jgi:hypothetical protein
MDCPAASGVRYISGIIHRCLCRFRRSPIALKLTFAHSWFATVSRVFLWDDPVVERLKDRPSAYTKRSLVQF